MSSITQANTAGSQRLNPRTCGMRGLLSLLLLGAVACENDDQQASDATTSPIDSSEAGTDSGANEADAASDAELDIGPGDDDAEPDAPPPDADPGGSTTGIPCEIAEDCDDGVFCNGAERCVEDPNTGDKTCQPALRPHCPAEHLPCDEVMHSCNCDEPDQDRDGDAAKVCGGDDCDDSDIVCHSKAREICDDDGRDEDCDVKTVGDRDSDKDGVVDQKCRNRDPDTGEWHQGADCDDQREDVNPNAPELCDYYDNNCNGFIDERTYKDGTFERLNGGLMNDFMLDWDQDEQGDKGSDIVRYCINDAPRRYILGSIPQDCDDKAPGVFEGAPEYCDGVDNDCDGLKDAEDADDLVEEYHFPGTSVRCVEGKWIIPEGGCPADTLWCPESGDPIGQGCRTVGTLLTSCRACETDCKFSCGQDGCDEVVKLGLGSNHACALTREGRVACWGQGSLGRLGNDNVKQSSVPVAVTISSARDIGSGFAHSCAVIGERRALYCWGDNSNGQLGQSLDGEPYSAVPVSVKGVDDTPMLLGVQQFAAGRQNTCAVLETGHLACFGQALGGMLANGETADRKWPPVLAQRMQYLELIDMTLPAEIDDATMVVLGGEHGCLLTRLGAVECWGDNRHMQLGSTASNEPSAFAIPVPGVNDVTSLAAGRYHTCALHSSGRVSCWGENNNFQLGHQTAEDSGPHLVAGISDAVAITAGQHFTCVRNRDESATCWGSNSDGQLGSPMRGNIGPTPAPAAQWVSLAAGANYVCGQSEGPIRCWGENNQGQLGNGSIVFDPTFSPTPIAPLAVLR